MRLPAACLLGADQELNIASQESDLVFIRRTWRTWVIPRAWSTLRSLSAATLPIYSPGLMQEGSSLVTGCTDSSLLVERWDALLSTPSSAHPLANSPPAKKGHAYSVLRFVTLQLYHPTLVGGGPELILEVDAIGVASSGQRPGWSRF